MSLYSHGNSDNDLYQPHESRATTTAQSKALSVSDGSRKNSKSVKIDLAHPSHAPSEFQYAFQLSPSFFENAQPQKPRAAHDHSSRDCLSPRSSQDQSTLDHFTSKEIESYPYYDKFDREVQRHCLETLAILDFLHQGTLDAPPAEIAQKVHQYKLDFKLKAQKDERLLLKLKKQHQHLRKFQIPDDFFRH